MPREKVSDRTTQDRYAQVSWRRDEHDPGHVQVSVHGPDNPAGEFTDLDSGGIDKLIKTLHKAKRQALGGECGQVPCDHAPDGGNHPLAVS